MPSWNEKALGLNSRKAVRWLSVSHSGFQYLLNLLQSWRMWRLDSIGYSPHGQLKSSLGKNLRRYSPIGAWFRMARAALAHNKLECPKCLIHGPPFLYFCMRVRCCENCHLEDQEIVFLLGQMLERSSASFLWYYRILLFHWSPTMSWMEIWG